ncbi:MAG: RNase adapter RapZ [Elusimicrobia bacterium]|nr:RNase adapter RapZ [Elusimicrobiota bacterium]
MSGAGKIFIITGMSGAGKSQALKCFEDFGFYCVDNLPLALFPQFVKFVHSRREAGDIALGIDIREGGGLKDIPRAIKALSQHGLSVKIIFLDASDSVLVSRFSETRHRHPLGKNIALAIKAERKMLLELKAMAYKAIDTANTTLGELKETLSKLLELKRSHEMKLSLISFGYKYGIPIDADIIMDVRFLANPNYIGRLKNKTGLDRQVAEYISKDARVKGFLERFLGLVKFLLPAYIKEGKSYLTIALGCTGGKHRSVYIADMLSKSLRAQGLSVFEFHKDIKKH